MITTREHIETIAGFGCRYRRVRRVWLLFGLLPVASVTRTERI